MLQLVWFGCLSFVLTFWLSKVLQQSLFKKRQEHSHYRYDYDILDDENKKLKTDNSNLEQSLNEITALYDITKDICKELDEKKIFNIFRERMDKYISVEDCQFIKEEKDVSKFQDYNILPLAINGHHIGHLVASGIREKDEDKFNILAQQFVLGIRRALLYERIQELSIIDSLTQVFNRRYFLQRLDEEIERSKRLRYKFSFIMVDIDNFKSINDFYGHLVGDVILREVSKTIKENLRQIDFVGRYGGEEFSLILTETDKDRARFAAQRIRKSVEDKSIKAYDENLNVTVSLGISVFPDDAKDLKEIIEKADKMMYKAKEAGRNRVFIFGE